MAGPIKLQLRVLYTINSSPQYILARSSFLIPVTPIPEPTADSKDDATQHKYATVALRACLDTICRSSPELLQDNNRDYSVYVLDPLESNSAPAPVNISNNGVKASQVVEQPKEHHYGVAVGLGLMSWALQENDGVVATGTRVKMNTGQEALEVIFALRETAAMQRTSLSSTMKTWGVPLVGTTSNPTHSQGSEPPSTVDPNMLSLSATPYANPGLVLTSKSGATSEASMAVQTRHKAGQKRKVSKPSTALTESDKIMYASETYIGPLKRKGRPRNPNSNGKPLKKSATEESLSVSAAPILSNFVQNSEPQKGSHPTSNTSIASTPLRFLTSALPSSDALQSAQGQASLLDLLTAISNGQNAHLLAALSTIDSTGTNQQQSSEPNPALVSAIGQLLLTACAKQSPQPVNEQPSSDFNQNCDVATSMSQDEDVVILDKENIDPLAFRRREEKFPEIKGNKAVTTNDISLEHHFTLNVLGQRFDGQENLASTNTMKRKRTLSDFMDEKESERSKQKEKERSERKEQHRHSTQRRSSGSSSIYDTGFRHYPRLASEALPMPGTNYYSRKPNDFRSSPPRPKVDSSNMSSNLRRSTTLPFYSVPKASASSPPRPSAGPPRKRYVVPEWARTNTVTQPRLSEEAQRALAEAEERKKKEKEERRKAISCKRLRQEPRASGIEQMAKQLRPPPSDAAAAGKSDPPATIATSHSCPVFATTGVAADIFSSSAQASQLSPPRLPPSSCPASNIPQTPPPKCASTLFTPDNRDDASTSLFTPTPKGKSGWPSGSAGSTLFTPRKQMPLSPSPPTTRGKSNKMSPIQAVISGGSIDGASRWNGATEEEEFRWDEPDGPPSSLPTASDVEDEPMISSTSEFETNDVESGDADDEDEREYNVKQHWPGLPPSSPPPSSPTLAPQDPDDDDVELTELPVPTSDIDESTSASSNDIQEPSNDDDETIKDEFDSFMSSLTSDSSLSSDIDIFNNLSTDIPDQRDGSHPFTMLDSSLEPILQNGVVEFDFTEFWESFKPMVQDFVTGNNAPSSDKADSSVPQNADQTKLAEDVHALFSGCLL